MTLKANKRILILCEGMTEYLYARSMQMELPRTLQRSVSIEVNHAKQQDPKSLALQALKKVIVAKKERNEYNDVWLFFDHDNKPQLKEAFEIIDKQGFHCAYSAMCIEHWFILHFENCGKAFSSGEEAMKYLMKYLPKYHKTKTNAFKELRDKLDLAIDRANLINKNQSEDLAVYQQNPHFTVNALYYYFEELKNP